MASEPEPNGLAATTREGARPAARELRLAARDGFGLAATLYVPSADAPRAVILINSATGVRRQYYARFAEAACERGFAVLTYDYRGIGGSRPRSLVGFQACMSDWGEKDQPGVIEWLAHAYPAAKLLVVGHSIGGQIVGLADHENVAAILAIAAQNGYWGYWPPLGRLRMLVYWYAVFPLVLAVLPYFPGWLGVGQDLPREVAREWVSWCRSPDFLFRLNRQARRARYAKFTGPLLAYAFEDDSYAPPRTVEALLSLYPNATTSLRRVGPAQIGAARIGHFGFFRESFRNSLWADALGWLEGVR